MKVRNMFVIFAALIGTISFQGIKANAGTKDQLNYCLGGCLAEDVSDQIAACEARCKLNLADLDLVCHIPNSFSEQSVKVATSENATKLSFTTVSDDVGYAT